MIDADIVYSSSVCFPPELNQKIGELSLKMKKGAILIGL